MDAVIIREYLDISDKLIKLGLNYGDQLIGIEYIIGKIIDTWKQNEFLVGFIDINNKKLNTFVTTTKDELVIEDDYFYFNRSYTGYISGSKLYHKDYILLQKDFVILKMREHKINLLIE